MNWDEYFLKIAETIAEKSKDPNTKVGAVIVSADHTIRGTGYNGFPMGVENTDERWSKPTKYDYVSHAELNACLFTGRERAQGCTLYFATIPISNHAGICNECAKAVIQAGIKRIIALKPQQEVKCEGWRAKLGVAETMLKEAKVEVVLL